ncbi:excinuclease ABC subunit UvrC [bacterium]|nr:excinuclease ABC subunit UvrC [bacterium]
MKEKLHQRVSKLPTRTGVYLMRDGKGEVIYVGKAKNLRSRVKSYFSGSDERHTVPYIVSRVEDIEVILTSGEHEAFVLERDLITQYKPRYNIRLKDDKSYLHVRIDRKAQWPKLELVRRPVEDGADYYGPFTFSYELRTVLDLIKKVVPLRTCRDAVFYNRQRPCLEYQIRRCSGPCCLEVDPSEYQSWLDQAVRILEGNTDSITEELLRLMDQASEELRFEDASLYRDRLKIIDNFSTRQASVSPGGENRDAFAYYREERLIVVSVLRVRNGRLAENHNFCLEGVEIPSDEVLASAISQFYQAGRVIPREILTPEPLESSEGLIESLKAMRGGSVEILQPQRGVKFRLLGLAALNAKEHFIAQFDREERYQQIAEAIAKTCRLHQMPRRIECLDISNLQGSDIVGAIVSFWDGQPDKSRYRQYRLALDGKPDDFAAIEEVMRRKLARAKMSPEILPDLLIIDGGRGQLERASRVVDEYDLHLDIVGLAKIRDSTGTKKSSGARRGDAQLKVERVFLRSQAQPIALDLLAESTRYLQRVRDEAHRYVIEFHRKIRDGRSRKSRLDEISGIGPERKRRLLKHFGSLKMIRGAAPEEIAKAGRMPVSLAHRLLQELANE